MREAALPLYGPRTARIAGAMDALGVNAVRWCTLAVFLAVTVFARFGINLGGGSLPVSLFALYALLAALVLSRRAQLAGTALLLYGGVLLLAYVSWFINSTYAPVDRSSPSSFAYLVALYLPFAIIVSTADATSSEWRWTQRAFSNIALICALAGIGQFFVQFVFDPPWLFDFTPLLPSAIRNAGTFNTAIPVGDLHKANGFFLREPSAFSFLMALATIIEINGDKRWRRVALFVFALIVSYSGTGVLALLIGLLFPLGRRTIARIVALALGAAILIGLLGEVLNLSFTVNRVKELGSEHSSAYLRYIAPFHLLTNMIDASPWSVLFGHGPGAIQRSLQSIQAFDPTWAKALFEYGLLGATCIVALILHALSQSRIPAPIAAVLFFSWLVMGGHLLSPDNVSLLYALAGMWRLPLGDAAATRDAADSAPHRAIEVPS